MKDFRTAIALAIIASIVTGLMILLFIPHQDRRAVILLTTAAITLTTVAAVFLEARRNRRMVARLERDIEQIRHLILDENASPRELRGSTSFSPVRALGELVAERQLELIAQKDTLAGILEGFGEGILAIDSSGRITLANRKIAELFSIRGEIAGRTYYEVIRDVRFREVIQQALRGDSATVRMPIVAGEEQRTMQLRGAPTRSGAVALFVDITELERLSRIRRDFIADFSHEVRTPLTALRSSAETLEEGGLNAGQESRLRQIMLRQLARLERLVSGLSELRTLESGDVRLERHPVDVVALLDNLRADFGVAAKEAGMEISIHGERPAFVDGDPVRLEQIFLNLLENGIRHASGTATLDVGIEREDEFVVVRISDQGPGIPRADRERIFNRFYQVDKSRSEGSGSGLGLAIVRHLVLLHGGSIVVEPASPKGASFVVRLPGAEPPASR